MASDFLQGINVFLIGMMGAGKTSVGRQLAQKLGYRFFDTDVLICQTTGMTINQIFAEEGEEGFRQLESQVLGELSAYTRSAVATGGGIVLRQKNWGYLHHGLVVWLDAPVEVIMNRIAGDTTRPLLQETAPEQKLTSLLEQRQSLYAQADLQISIEAEQTPETIAWRVIEEIPTVLKSQNR